MWEPWLQFFVGSISHSARDAIELCDDLSALHQHNKNAIKGNNRRSDIDEKKTDKLLGIFIILYFFFPFFFFFEKIGLIMVDMCYRMPYITKPTVAFLFGIINTFINLIFFIY